MEIQNYSSNTLLGFLPALFRILEQAGNAIMEVYNMEIDVTIKRDNSPVTLADLRSSDIIVKGLQSLTPYVPILCEETQEEAFVTRRLHKYIWVVDPLDGTKEFIKKNGEFAINIALVEDGVPVLGIIYAPVKEVFYYAIKGAGAYKLENGKEVLRLPLSEYNELDKTRVRAIVSRSHCNTDDESFVNNYITLGYNVETITCGSSLKFGVIAEGNADLYPKHGNTSEWDTASGQVILEESGGVLLSLENLKPLVYNKQSTLNPFFVAKGKCLL